MAHRMGQLPHMVTRLMTMDAYQDITITVIPDPCWTPAMEAAAQEWLAVIRYLEQRSAQDGALSAHDGSRSLDGRTADGH